MVQLGIDAGASRTKWSLAQGAAISARGDSPALTGHVFTGPQQRGALARIEALRASVEAASPAHPPASIVAGVSGLEHGEPAALTVAALLARVFGLPERAVSVHSDLRLTYLAYHRPGEGVLVYAGTGSIAYHLGAQGETRRSGGYGYLLADEGGALWMARQALRHLLRQLDEGEAPSPVLAAKFRAALGDLSWPRLRAFVYGEERAELAALAPLVSQAAQEGDPAAQAILREGARELARLVRCLARQAPSARTVTATGGALSDPVLSLLRAELAQTLSVRRGTLRVSDANAQQDIKGGAENSPQRPRPGL